MAAERHLTAELFRNLDDERLLRHWRQLQTEAVRIDPFSTDWWCRAGGDLAGAVEPCIALVCDSGRPLALATLGLRPTRNGNVLVPYTWSSHRDYFDVLSLDDSEAVITRLCDGLPWEQISQVHLESIPVDSPIGPVLRAACQRHGLRGVMYVNGGAPQLRLLDEHGKRYQDFRGIMQGKTSKQLQRRLAKLGEVKYVRADRRKRIPVLMSSLFWLHQKRWHETPSPSILAESERRAATLRTAQGAFDSNMLHLSVLYVNEQPMAGVMGYVIRKIYYYHIVAMNPDFRNHSPVRTNMTFLLNDLLKETQVETFDYLAGAESYKLVHATGNRELLRLRMTRSRSKAVSIKMVGAADRCLRDHAKVFEFARTLKHKAKKLHYNTMRWLKRLLSYRRLGPWRFLVKALGAVGHKFYERRELLVLTRCFTGEPSETDGITVRPGRLEDCNRLTVTRHGFLDPRGPRIFFERTREGMRYYVALLEGEPVGSVWIQVGGTYAPSELHGALEVIGRPEGDGFLIEAWTAPDARGERIYPALIEWVGSELSKQNACDRLLVAIDVKNMPDVRAYETAGFTRLESLEIQRLFGRIVRKKRIQVI